MLNQKILRNESKPGLFNSIKKGFSNIRFRKLKRIKTKQTIKNVVLNATLFVTIVSIFTTVFSGFRVAHATGLEPITVNAYKVVCEEESDLPNWGEGGNNRPSQITSTTAQDFVNNSNGKCWLQPNWEFQWGYDSVDEEGIEGVHKLIGNHLGQADGTPSTCYFQCGNNTQTGSDFEDWKNFDSTTSGTNTPAQTEVEAFDEVIPGIWVRENLVSGYIPYTYPPKGSFEDNVTAELYCHHDIRNYDNYDLIYNPKPGNTYYCVAFNVLAEGEGIDLSVTKDDGITQILEGEETTYTIVIKNNGSITSYGVKAIDTLPAGTDFVTATNNGIYANGKITWSFDSLTPEQEIQVQLTVRVENNALDNHTQIDNVVLVSDNGQNGPDLNPENNTDQDIDVLVDDEIEFETPLLQITKSNNRMGQKLVTGQTVRFNIFVTAFEDLEDVIVVDLPSEGFDYNSGSWTASSNVRGDIKSNNIVAEPTYSSPGTWTIGSMQKDEVITLSYITTINSDVDDGLYKDLAWTRGYYQNALVLGNEGINNLDTFVGTEVEVVSPNPSPEADVDVEIKEITKIVEVLGASDSRLPATGLNVLWIILVTSLFLFGLVLVSAGLAQQYGWVQGVTFDSGSSNDVYSDVKDAYKKIANIVVNFGETLEKAVKEMTHKKLSIALAVMASLAMFGAIISTNTAQAATELSVKIEEPESAVNEGFKIGFVALDINNADMTVKCMVKKPGNAGFSQFGSNFNTGSGGNSGDCDVDGTVLTTEGTYEFKVTAQSTSGNIESQTVTVKYDKEAPQKPKYIEVNKKNSCKYEIKFKTANDGQTSYVEVYRSEKDEFEADEESRIKTVNIGPDETYEFDDELNGDDCDDRQYYAIRAFDSAGNPSKVKSEDAVVIVEEEKTVSAGGIGGIGAIQVDGTLQGGTRSSNTGAQGSGTNGDGLTLEDEEGSVLGEIDDPDGDHDDDGIKNAEDEDYLELMRNKETSEQESDKEFPYILILPLVFLGIYFLMRFRSKN